MLFIIYIYISYVIIYIYIISYIIYYIILYIYTFILPHWTKTIFAFLVGDMLCKMWHVCQVRPNLWNLHWLQASKLELTEQKKGYVPTGASLFSIKKWDCLLYLSWPKSRIRGLQFFLPDSAELCEKLGLRCSFLTRLGASGVNCPPSYLARN